MGVYIPGAFKKALISTPVINVEEKKEVILDNVQQKIPENKLKLENPIWKKVKIDEKKDEKKEEIKPITYLRHNAFLRRKAYYQFVEDEWENLWDMYDRMLNYDYIFLDKLRNSEDEKGFYDFTKLVFVHLTKVNS